MEEELIAQRDAAIAVTKELQRQLQQHREVMERKFERRSLTAERLRFHAEEELRRVQEERAWEVQMCQRLLYLSLFCGMIGAIVGWLLGVVVLVLLAQPLFGFLLILPGMASGSVLGLAIAKTKVQLENRRRDAKRKQKSRHAEVEMAVHGSVSDGDDPLEPLDHVPGLEGVAQQFEAANNAANADKTVSAGNGGGGGGGYAAAGYQALVHTWWTSVDVAQSLYRSRGYVEGVFSSSDAAKKDQ